MKTILVGLTACLLISFSEISVAQIAVGAKGGSNINSFRGNNEYDAVPGYNIGGFAKYPITKFLNARAEILYFKQGANLYDYVFLSPELKRSNARVAFHNIQVPIIAELGLPSLNEDAIQPKLLLGGFFSYTMQARETYTNVVKISGYDQVTYSGHSDISSLFRKNQVGLLAGIAAEVKLFGKPVSFEFRYHYNLNKVNVAGTQNQPNMIATHQKWGNDLKLATLSFNVAVTLSYF
jgi:hypothetical protein